MENRRKMKMVKKINDIIDAWDPIGLFPFAPKDEYLDESQTICIAYTKGMSTKELAQIIHQVFIRSFGITTFTKSIGECEVVAYEIINAL